MRGSWKVKAVMNKSATVYKRPLTSNIKQAVAALKPVSSSMDASELEYEKSQKRLLRAMDQMRVDPVLREQIEARLS